MRPRSVWRRWPTGRCGGATPALTFLITAIGMSFVLQEFVHFVLPKIIDGYGGSNAQQPIILVQPKTQFHIFGATVSNITLIIVGSALVLARLTYLAVHHTKFGRGIRAVAQDPTTATLMGVSGTRHHDDLLIGGVLAGAAALLYTLRVPRGIIYSGGFLLGIKAFSAAVLGGIGNLRGALLGGLLLGIMENYGQAVFGTQWRDVVAFVLLVLVLLIRPTGILGEPREGQGMSAHAAGAALAPGDALRRWWADLGRVQKWGFGVLAFGALALLPLYTPGFLDTPESASAAPWPSSPCWPSSPSGSTSSSDRPACWTWATSVSTLSAPTPSPCSPARTVRGTRWAPTGFSAKWAWLACVPIAMAATALAGLILGTPTLRLRGLPGHRHPRLRRDHPADGGQPLRDHQRSPRPERGGVPARRTERGAARRVFSSGNSSGDANYGTWWFWLGLILIVVILLLVGNLERSRVGRAWVAIREDEDAAEVMGVNTFRFKLWAFVIGAAIGGLSGALYAGQVQYVARRRSTSSTRCCSSRRWCSAARATSSG